MLAQKLKDFQEEEILVLGLTRGGVVVAHEVAQELGAPWDILVVKKIGAPGNPELALGAVGPDKVVIWDEKLCQRVGVDEETKGEMLKSKSYEREEKEKFLRQGRKLLSLEGKMVILVDDGIATGATTLTAVRWVQTQRPKKTILAVPVAPPDALEKLINEVDEIICLETPWDFAAVGQFYEDFPQVSDEEVRKIFHETNRWSW